MTFNRAYSVLTIKAVDAEKRRIAGIASTPTPDRLGDIVDPEGIEFKNPMPLLWQHRHDQPVGEVRFKKPTKDGVEFEARLTDPSDAESPALKERLMEAWDSVKLGLVRAVSIGFKALEWEWMKDGDGILFSETEVLELSLVTIPANRDAIITEIKSIDAPLLASSGINRKGMERPIKPAVAGSASKSAVAEKPITLKERKVKTYSEQIAGFEATLVAKAAEQKAILDKAAEENRTMEKDELESHDTLEADIANINEHIKRLRVQEARNVAAAKPVEPAVVAAAASQIDVGTPRTITRVQVLPKKLPPCTKWIRFVSAMTHARNDVSKALRIAQRHGWQDECPEVITAIEHFDELPDLYMRAAVGAGTTTDATWAAPLVAYNIIASEFIELLRGMTIIPRIPGLRMVPFNIQMPSALTGTSVGWVGENAPKPVSQMTFGTVTLRWAKAAGIVVLTDELVKFSNPNAESVVRQDLGSAMAAFLDRQFIDPSVAEVTNVSPASITNGVTAIVPSGATEAAFRTDVKSLFALFSAANIPLAGGVWIMHTDTATSLGLMINALGQASFPSVGGGGGTLLGFPVVTSTNIPASTGSPAEGYPIIFAIAPEIMVADDGQTFIDASNQASVQMETAPDSPPTASTNMVSLWQMNMTGLRAERWINWKKRRSAAVQYITSAKYG